jgi:hypothetical protein
LTASPAKKITLFFTAGVSDLKFVAECGELLELARPRTPVPDYASIRAVHQALLDRKHEICVCPFDAVELPESTGKSDINFWKGDDPLSRAPIGGNMVEYPLLRTADGRLVLVADKLRSAWQSLSASARVVAVVGFRTWRPDRRDEPIAAEEIIFHRLVAATCPSHSDLINYVEGNDSKDAPFTASAVKRIDLGVRKCRDKLGKEAVSPLLAVSGGVPGIKEVLRAAVELHFGPAQSLLEREGGPAAFFGAPQDTLIARRHALDFVRRGAFIEAAAVAQPFHADEEACDGWVRPLRCAARLLDGNPVAAYANDIHPACAEHWERGKPAPAFLREIARTIVPGPGKPQLRCLLVSIRTEAALRSGRFADAICLTVTFFDAAMRDAIEQKFGVFSEENDQLIKLSRTLSRKEQTALVDTTPYRERPDFKKGRYPCLILQERRSSLWRVYSSTAHDRIWCRKLGPELQKLRVALDAEIDCKTLRDIRNQIMHNVLTDEQLTRGQRMCEELGLWSNGSFLAGKHATAVVTERGCSGGTKAYDRIVGELENALLGTT